MNLKQIAQKLWSKTQDDEGFIRQGNFTPGKQIQQMGQNLSAWGNVANQGIKNQIDIQKRDFNKYTWQPLKENPVLAPTLNRFEQATPAIGNQLKQLNPFAQKQTPQQNWQDTKKIGAAALTTAGLLASPAVKLSSMLGGAVISPIITAGMNKLEGKPIGQGVVESIPVGAGQGLANAGTTRLTNYLVQGLANKIPLLKSLTEEAIKKGVPAASDTLKEGFKKLINTGGKRLIKASVLETAVESPIWATLTQTDKETYLEALQRETEQNLIMNVGMAGVNTVFDSRTLLPIVKKSIDTAVDNYMKSASTPQAIANQSGKIDLNAKVELPTQPINTGEKYSFSNTNYGIQKNPDGSFSVKESRIGNSTKTLLEQKIPDDLGKEYQDLLNQKDELKGSGLSVEATNKRMDVQNKLGDLTDRIIRKLGLEDLGVVLDKDGKIIKGNIEDEANKLAEELYKNGKLTPELTKQFQENPKQFLIDQSQPIKTGENPKIFYHGTKANFNKFDDTKLGSNTEWLNSKWGHFFSEDKNIAKRFLNEDSVQLKDTRTGRIIEAELDLKKPLDFTPEGLTTNKEQAQIIYEAMTGEKISPNKALEYIKDAYEEASGMGGTSDFYDEIYSNLKIKELAQKKGYDGIISHYGELDGKNIKEYGVFSANQIKIKPSPIKTGDTIKLKETPKVKVSEPFIDKNGELQFPNIKQKTKGIEMTKEEAENAANFAELKSQEDPKAFDNIFANWIGKRESAKTKATVEASKFSNVPGNPEDIIKSVEGGKVKLTPEQQTYSTELRKTYDQLFQEAKKEGIDMNYLENYLTHIWDKPLTQVAQDYKTAKQTFGFAGNRSLPTYEEGIKMGLKPKYTNPAQILESYTQRLKETTANMELFRNLKKEGLIVSGSKVTGNPNFAPINAPGFPRAKFNIGDQQTVISNWYAPKNIADQINRIFTPQDFGTLGKVAQTGANVSGAIQDITLSGGLPKTPLNAWSIAQATKEVLSGRIISPFKNLFRSLSTNASNKFFEENAGQIIKMQERNIPLQTTFNTENLINQSTAKKLFGDSIGSAWNKTMNEPTFKRFMPQLEISLFNDIEGNLIKRGIDANQAADTAAQAVKNFYGIVGTDALAKRSKLGKDLTQAVLFAPRYRESMINFWANNIKALKNPLAPENITNTKFAIGAILSFVAMNEVNKANTGKNMWENPEGKEDKMLIKTKDGYIGVPFLSSIATIPRLTFKATKHLISGNLPQTVNDMKSLLSSGVRPVVDVFTNEDYFGGEIYDPDSTNKWGDIGLYLAGQYNHPYIREIMNVSGQSLSPEVKKKLGLTKDSVPAYQTFSKALELPFRFYNNKVGRDALSSAYFYESKDEALKELNTNEKNIYKTLEQKRPDDISASADIQMDMAEALTLLANPSVMRAKTKTAIDTAAKTGETLDPFYTLTPEQQQTVLRLKTFYPGDKEKSNMTTKNIDWLKPYWTARSAYFDELESKGIIEKQEESEEYASPEIQAKLDYYYTLPYGTGDRTKYINANPDLVEYWDKKRAITNEKRSELGLSEQEGFSKWGSGKKAKKITFKVSSPKALPKINIKISSPVSKIKLKSAPKIKLSTSSNRKYTIKA